MLKGLDIAGIQLVVQYGMTQDVPLLLQRGGQAGCSTLAVALFLIMFEPWVLNIDLSNVTTQISENPDHPITDTLETNAKKSSYWLGYNMLDPTDLGLSLSTLCRVLR